MGRREQVTRGRRDDFSVARREFQRWRSAGRPGVRIPDRLWELAIDLARDHGAWRTARELGLDSAAVKRRLALVKRDRRGPKETEPGVAFLEVPGWRIAQALECVVELVDEVERSRMWVEVKGGSMTEVTALAESLWSARR